MQRNFVFALGALGALALVAFAPALAGETGYLMKVTTTSSMQMGSMHMPSTTRTDKICTPPHMPDVRQLIKQRRNCKLTDYKRTGDTVTYHMACSGDFQMTGAGTITILAGGGIRGTFHGTGNADGRSVVMSVTEDGQRIGTCNYTPPQTH